VVAIVRTSGNRLHLGRCAAFATAFVLAVSGPARPDVNSIDARIRREGQQRTSAERVFRTLTLAIGPRLTASPAHKRAAEFIRDELRTSGLSDAHLEPFRFGPGWELQRFTIEMTAPRYMPLLAYPEAWSPGTKGVVEAPLQYVGDKSAAEVRGLGPSLRGAILLVQPPVADFVRADRPQPDDSMRAPAPPSADARAERAARAQEARDLENALRASGAAALVRPSPGEYGTVFVTGNPKRGDEPPALTMAGEHYNMLVRLAREEHTPVKLRVDVEARLVDADEGNAYNVVAELPGRDPSVRDEVVMIGAHLDSWHASVGATDNADGVATVVEAMRILAALGEPPRRTIRVALWGGEEQGLLGSSAWVAKHLMGADGAEAREKFDLYLNLDAGTGPIYGWYTQLNSGARAMFDRWLAPLSDLGARGNVNQPIGASDHVSFVAAGLPGFTAIQDYTHYDSHTHHTNMDTADRVDVADLSKAAVVLATIVYQAADAEEKVPRAKLQLPGRSEQAARTLAPIAQAQR
jgi:carboxypeptidase Q